MKHDEFYSSIETFAMICVFVVFFVLASMAKNWWDKKKGRYYDSN